MMKLFDRLLKKLQVNRNTFFTYIFTLISFYICIDRIVEMLLLIFTGVSSSYWGPFKYTIALICPALAYAFSPKSSFANSRGQKVTLFYLYLIALYIIALSMFTQWLNQLLWILFISVPNYAEIVTQFPSMVRHAFSAIALYLPLRTIYPFVVHTILQGVNDNGEKIKSIWDYTGINLSDSSIKHNSYMCDVSFVYDYYTGKKVTFAEQCRYRSLLVCGGSGTGKTTRVFEPMIAQDIERKFFFKEASKELGFTALKTGIAQISHPYSNEYLNENFNLNMLTPSFGKEAIFNTFMQKMLLTTSPKPIYRNIGLTYLSPDNESISKMISVCENYGISYTLIDPLETSGSKGLNPFIYDDPNKIAVTISSTLNGIKSPDNEHFSEDTVIQILENLTILLKLIYPQMHDGVLPNMEDLLTLLNNFELVQKMCEILKTNESYVEEYQMQITFFEKNFYPNSRGFENMEKYAFYISSRLENLLRSSKIKNILCNRHNNINFDDVLANGEFIFICTRRGDSGRFASTAFGLFFILSMQNAVLRRPGTEKTRIPHYLYIDEFPDFVTKDTETIFTMYRKYCVGTTISAQSISMFGTSGVTNVSLGNVVSDNSAMAKFNSTILSNCSSKVFTGGAAPIDELQWWQKEIGQWKQWLYSRGFDGSKGPTGKMDPKLSGVKFDYKDKVMAGNLQFLADNACAYKIVGDNGRPMNSDGIINFIAPKYNEKHKGKKYDFSKYVENNGVSDSESNASSKSKKVFDPKKVKFRDKSTGEDNPIQANPISEYLFDNEDAVVVNLKKNKKN